MPEKRPPTIIELLVESQKIILRVQRIELLQRIARMKKQLELDGINTNAMFSAETIKNLKGEFDV
jgi:hypothetical protein